MTERLPPEHIVSLAIELGNLSGCQKSQRGVVIFNPSTGDRIGRGFNAPVATQCDGSAACRKACPKICIHAEESAIYEALGYPVGRMLGARNPAGLTLRPWEVDRWGGLAGLELLHVKVLARFLVGSRAKMLAGGPPSCVQCSRLVMATKIAGVWLFEATRWHDERDCDRCGQPHLFTSPETDAETCPRLISIGDRRWACGRELSPLARRVYDEDSGAWRYYTGEEFHRVTLKNNGLPGGAP